MVWQMKRLDVPTAERPADKVTAAVDARQMRLEDGDMRNTVALHKKLE